MTDIQSPDVSRKPYRLLDLFSGIGGFSLGLENTGGFETVAFCEISEFPRRVLAKHWPNVPCYADVRELTSERLAADGIAPNVICGGFPCQDISTAGRQAGMGEGTRSGLWSECIRLVGELRPHFAIFENVSNLLLGPSDRSGAWFSRILSDLAAIGYDAEWENIPAAAMGAPHLRERVWLIAYPSEEHCGKIGTYARIGSGGIVPNDVGSLLANQFQWRSEPAVDRVDDGFSRKLDRYGALGNAVVPQIPELIGRAILRAIA